MVEVAYNILLSPAQAPLHAEVAAALEAAIAGTGDEDAFTTIFEAQARLGNALPDPAAYTYMSVSGTQVTFRYDEAPFSFLVSDTSGPQIVSYDPPVGALDVHPATSITLVFSEAVQKGTGSIKVHQGNSVQGFDVHDTSKVNLHEKVLSIKSVMWFDAGHVSVEVPPGLVYDDAHSGTLVENPFAGSVGEYNFTVKSPPVMATRGFVSIGAGASSQHCVYTLAEPWWVCHSFEECAVFVKPIGPGCGHASAGTTARKVSYKAMQKIHEQFPGLQDGGLSLSYSGGIGWPEVGLSEFL